MGGQTRVQHRLTPPQQQQQQQPCFPSTKAQQHVLYSSPCTTSLTAASVGSGLASAGAPVAAGTPPGGGSFNRAAAASGLSSSLKSRTIASCRLMSTGLGRTLGRLMVACQDAEKFKMVATQLRPWFKLALLAAVACALQRDPRLFHARCGRHAHGAGCVEGSPCMGPCGVGQQPNTDPSFSHSRPDFN